MNQQFNPQMIMNNAFYKIGAKRMAAAQDSSNPNSVFVNDIYLLSLQEVLEEHVWSFAIQTVGLASINLVTALPIMNDGVSYPYALPADFVSPYLFSAPCFIRLEKIKPPYTVAPVLALLSDNNNLLAMKYVFLNQDTTDYSAKFCNTLSSKIASKLCFKISEFSGKADAMEALYQRDLISAIGSDSNSGTPDDAIANTWFVARLAGSGAVSGLPDGNVGWNADPYNAGF